MVMDKLHLICGNCGQNDMFEFEIDLTGSDYGDHFEPEVYIHCRNCGTSHSLSRNAEFKKVYSSQGDVK